MASHDEVLYGRQPVERLVLDLMRRATPDSPRPASPVLVLVGPPGAGKTRLLDVLADGFEWQVPYAKLDFASYPNITVRQVLRFLTFELNRWCADYGRIGFGRFLVGELVMSLDVDLLDRRRARAGVKEALERYRNVERLRAFVQALAEDVSFRLTSARPRATVEYGSNLLLDGLVRWRPLRRVVLGRATEWYGRTRRGVRTDALDALVDLSRSSRADDPLERAAVDALALEAFVADLDEQFGDGYPVHRRPRYCPVLLDNADTGNGPAFLDRLVAAHRERVRAGGGRLPLVVVATTQRCRPGTEPRGAEEAGYADWAAGALAPDGSPRGEDVWRYQVALRDLSVGELYDLAVSRHLPEPRHIARFLHRLTGGHPSTSVVFAEALATKLAGPGRPPRDQVATMLRGVLALPAPGADSRPLSDHLRDRLLPGVDTDTLDWLVTISAARTLNDAVHALAPGTASGLPPDLHAAGAWIVPDGNGSQVLHPLPRRLLLAELATRHGSAEGWDRAHQRLRDYCHDIGDRDGVLYHELAMAHVSTVVGELATELTVSDAQATGWFARFVAITSAPNRLPGHEPPLRSVERFLRDVDTGDPRTSVLTQLTVARWRQSDPLGDPSGELDGVMAAAYRHLARLSPNGFEIFTREADHHDRREGDGG